ncbi:MAG: FtsW/RodA/SpoVE family cell cycle protein [Victivallaceae bacterium]|nr:FtsW/RodA/SpoVE family cell cycle protein [Victivallaceae bacterium]
MLDGVVERRGKNIWSPFFGYLRTLDWNQIIPVALLLGISVVFIASIGKQIGTAGAEKFYIRQLCWIAAGFCAWTALGLPDFRIWKILAPAFYLAVMLLLVAVPLVGVKVYGATRWIELPMGVRLQPSELMKPALALLLAALFSRAKVNSFGTLLVAGVVTMLPFYLIIREPDLGGAIILLPLAAAIVFVAGLKKRLLLLIGSVVILMGAAAIMNEVLEIHPLLKSYQKARIVAFLNPEYDPRGANHNQLQSLLAVGSGAWTGKGLGQGTQNTLGFLPQTVSNNDFIFSVIGEETGFLGALAVLFLYGWLLCSIAMTGVRSRNRFGMLFCCAVATFLFVNVFVNIGMSIGLTPVTGLTLPLVSYGGSSLLCVMASLGIVQSIHRHEASEY